MNTVKQIARELGVREHQVQQTISLLDEGSTIPFIARYRKEATGELDETVIRDISHRVDYLRHLDERREQVRQLIAEQDKLDDQTAQALDNAAALQELEDIYRPFRPKRRTRASNAKDKGLEPLADSLEAQNAEDPISLAESFLSDEVGTVEEALQGAQDILAERFADDVGIRDKVRQFFRRRSRIVCEGEGQDEASDFAMYFGYAEAVSSIPPHRILAINRGERREELKVRIEVDTAPLLLQLERSVIKRNSSPAVAWVKAALADGFQRLIAPSVQREIRNELTAKAEEHGIRMFGRNLHSLLMQPPVRGRTIIGIDPAYRTGCKVVVVNTYGDLLDYTTIYPHQPKGQWTDSMNLLSQWVERYSPELIVIGNGTASRETEQLAAELIKTRHPSLQYLVTNEAGASVYSASDTARAEFPDLDVAMRGAVSIARRVQDPLAELVKIDPKSIGVGLYQHDVDQKALSRTLGEVVESCVNFVGVDVNSASNALLQHVAGLSPAVARNIMAHRQSIDAFRERRQLAEVKGLGPKKFEQCAGFLRIADGREPLDNTGVHPESYPIARKILSSIGHSPEDLRSPAALAVVREKLKTLSAPELAEQLDAGEPTVRDILANLAQPGRDPRDELPPPLFRADVLTIDDLEVGMVLKGTVQNVVDFGAFVDIGVKKAGLVHISQLSSAYVKHPLDVVQPGDVVEVQVISIEPKQERIGLTLVIQR